MLGRITDWKISGEESISDHSIITYGIKMTKKPHKNTNMEERKYRVNSENTEKYNEILSSTAEIINWEQSSETSEDDLETRLYKRIIKDNQTEKQIEYFSEAMRIVSEQSFKTVKV